MVAESAPEQVACGHCGFLDSGNFCGNCGAELRPGRDTLLRAIGSDIFDFGSRHSYFVVLPKVLRSPIRSALELARDSAYRGHWNFILASGAFSTVLSIFLGLLSRDRGESDNHTIFFIFFFVQMFVGKLVFQWLSPQQQSSRSYFKLCCVAGGFALIVLAIAQLLAAIVFIAFLFDIFSLGSGSVVIGLAAAAIVSSLVQACAYIYLFFVQKRFWRLSMLRIFIAYFLILLAFLAALAIFVVLVTMPLFIISNPGASIFDFNGYLNFLNSLAERDGS